MAPTETKQWQLANPPVQEVDLSGGPNATFKLATVPLPQLKQDQVLLQAVYLSNDPAQRGWMSGGLKEERMYAPLVKRGEVMRTSSNVVKVVASSSSQYPEGCLCLASTGWAEYAVRDAKECQPVQDVAGLSPTHFLGALGLTGLTAYFGLLRAGRATKDDVVVVSGAGGATGRMAVQIAKHILGCGRVVGIAGGAQKCRWVESLGADACVDYKSASFATELEKATPDNANVFFDNVGGAVLDAMLARMARNGRVAQCGVITGYNDEQGGMTLKNYFDVVAMRIQITGFIVSDYADEIPKAMELLSQSYKEGKLKIGSENETVVDTKFEDIPKTWTKLFTGENQGKLVTHLV